MDTQTGIGPTVFNNQNELFYISGGQSNSDHKVQQYRFEPDYCASVYVRNVEPNCCNYGRTAIGTDTASVPVKSLTTSAQAERKSAGGTDSKVNIYPNPASDVLNITSTGKISGIIITGAEGKIYVHKHYLISLSQIQLSVFGLPAGMYFVSVISSGNTVNRKVIITQ